MEPQEPQDFSRALGVQNPHEVLEPVLPTPTPVPPRMKMPLGLTLLRVRRGEQEASTVGMPCAPARGSALGPVPTQLQGQRMDSTGRAQASMGGERRALPEMCTVTGRPPEGQRHLIFNHTWSDTRERGCLEPLQKAARTVG